MNAIIRKYLLAVLLSGFSLTASANVILEWNEKVEATGVKVRQLPVVHARAMAIVHLSMFDAVNSIERRYTPYRVQLPAAAGTSPEVAAAAAAHYATVHLYPEEAKELDAFYEAQIARVADSDAKANAIKLGEQVATQILALRAKDGADKPDTYRPVTTPGKYVLTALPANATWSDLTPFALTKGSQFRPPAPMSLQSAQWAKDYEEVKRMGAKTGSARTPEQTVVARFWETVGPQLHNPIVRKIAAAKNLDLVDTARAAALYAMATSDAYVAIFDAKYAYNFWRPITAIRNGDTDGNDATERDASWEPLISTPMHPEYPCAHCVASGATAAVFAALFGDEVHFTLNSPTAPGVTREYNRLSDYVQESIEARICDGVHYRTSGEVGAALGRSVGQYAVQNYLKPVP